MVAFSDYLALPVAAAFSYLNPPRATPHIRRSPALFYSDFDQHDPPDPFKVDLMTHQHSELLKNIHSNVAVGTAFHKVLFVPDNIKWVYKWYEHDCVALTKVVQDVRDVTQLWAKLQTQMSDQEILQLRKIAPACSSDEPPPAFVYFRTMFPDLNAFWLNQDADLQQLLCRTIEVREPQTTVQQLKEALLTNGMEHTTKSWAEMDFELNEAEIDGLVNLNLKKLTDANHPKLAVGALLWHHLLGVPLRHRVFELKQELGSRKQELLKEWTNARTRLDLGTKDAQEIILTWSQDELDLLFNCVMYRVTFLTPAQLTETKVKELGWDPRPMLIQMLEQESGVQF